MNRYLFAIAALSLSLVSCKKLGQAFQTDDCINCDFATPPTDNGQSPAVVTPACGDGTVQGGEECDDGASNGGACTAACKLNVCGDGVLLPAAEDCDDGNTTTETCAYGEQSCTVCNAQCVLAPGVTSFCGDGIAGAGEECDAGGSASLACPYGHLSCRRCGGDCKVVMGTTSFCGDGIKQDEEACDLGRFDTPPCPVGSTGCLSCDRSCNLVPGRLADPRVYRVAFVDGALHVRNFSPAGTINTVFDVALGGVRKPSWSWDGSFVSYPIEFNNFTYIYEGAAPGGQVGGFTIPDLDAVSFWGSPPAALTSFGPYAKLLLPNGSPTFDQPNGLEYRLLQTQPGSSNRFAFIDFSGATNDHLKMYDATNNTNFSVATQVRSFTWNPDGSAIAYISGGTTCSVMTTVIGAAAAASPVVRANNVPCGAVLSYGVNGDVGVIANNKLYWLRESGGLTYDIGFDGGLAYSSSDPVADVGFTPDARYLSFLAGPNGNRHLLLMANGATGPIDTGLACNCNGMAISPIIISP